MKSCLSKKPHFVLDRSLWCKSFCLNHRWFNSFIPVNWFERNPGWMKDSCQVFKSFHKSCLCFSFVWKGKRSWSFSWSSWLTSFEETEREREREECLSNCVIIIIIISLFQEDLCVIQWYVFWEKLESTQKRKYFLLKKRTRKCSLNLVVLFLPMYVKDNVSLFRSNLFFEKDIRSRKEQKYVSWFDSVLCLERERERGSGSRTVSFVKQKNLSWVHSIRSLCLLRFSRFFSSLFSWC